jgi:hypothetical protein
MQHHVLLNDLTFKQHVHVARAPLSVSDLAIYHLLRKP